MMTKNNLDDLQLRIASHFLYAFSSDSTIASDHYMYLLPGLLGIPRDNISSFFFEFCNIPPKRGIMYTDPLIDFFGQISQKYLMKNLDSVSIIKSFKHEDFRAFSQARHDNGTIIDIWVGATAIIGVLSMIISDYDDCNNVLKSNTDDNNIKNKIESLGIKISSLNRLLKIWKKYNAIIIDKDAQLDLCPELSKKARMIFLDSLSFIIFHELAHHSLGHLNLKGSNQSNETMHQNEYAADNYAIKDCLDLTKNYYNRGPMVCFIAACLLNKEDDDIPSATHPSIIDRTKNYIDQLIKSCKDDDMEYWIHNYLLRLLRTILLNLDDKDRTPVWFGHSKDEYIKSTKKSYKSDVILDCSANISYDVNIFNLIDTSRPKAKREKIEFI